ncbi:MAG: hypothetical protein LBH44_10020 [Treponema sp.]|jgi:hypothetical protein|nr:hypothetical protein [Treponema sp.]
MFAFKEKNSFLKTIICPAVMALLSITLFLTCDMPMGLGDPVDTTPPTIKILTPKDNDFIRGILLGKPITLSGTCSDNVGVTALEFEIYDRTNAKSVKPSKVNYKINKDDTWWAELVITNAGSADYRIKVKAFDKGRNEGGDQVNITIDIVPPWIKEARILRHPGSGKSFGANGVFVKDLEYYRRLQYDRAEAYRSIKWENIDDFQNESFTLKVLIEPAFSNVAASRLYILDDKGEKLHNTYLAPTRDTNKLTPEWDFTHTQLTALRSAYSSGAHYLSFEVWAWSASAWENGAPIPGELPRVQRIDGTCWYPESDSPHISVYQDNMVNGIITLEPNKTAALLIDFYDDDKLAEIYAGFVSRATFDTLRGSDDDESYMQSLLTNTTRRDAAIAQIGSDRYDHQVSGENRHQTVSLNTGAVGEYYLIALVKDDKSSGDVSDYTFAQGEKWSVCPATRVQVKDAQEPLVIVESPAAENIFPNLSALGGNRFNFSGYTLNKGVAGTQYVQIAWSPAGNVTNARTALESSEAAALSPGSVFDHINGTRVWKLTNGTTSKVTFNGVEYTRTNFSRQFNIIDDFTVSGTLHNTAKTLVIHAVADASAFQNFRLTGWSTGPSLEITSHGMSAVHDTKQDLALRMRVNPGSTGVAIDPASVTITDVTGDSKADGLGTLTLSNGEYRRTVTQAHIEATFDEGSTRTYRFTAKDILGNLSTDQRNITMSHLPVLEYITCSNGEGEYGIGEILNFEAVFSMPVRIFTGGQDGPRLKLYFTDNFTSVSREARYVPGAAGNTVRFTYTVQNGDDSAKLHTSLDPFNLNSGLIRTIDDTGDALRTFTTHTGRSLQERVTVKVDGVNPRIERASFRQPGDTAGAQYYNNGKTVTLKLLMNKEVRVSGSPVARIASISGTILNMDAQFSSIDNTTVPGKSILYFTATVNDGGTARPESQLRLVSPYFTSGVANNSVAAITDMVGNPLVLTGLPSNNNMQGDANGSYIQEQAFIKTTIPAVPNLQIWTAATGGTQITGTASVISGEPRFIRMTGGEANATLMYSLEGGNAPKALSATAADNIIPDTNAGSNHLSTYKRSEYSVTVWQVDRAGNSSAVATPRQVTINSRAPELKNIGSSVPDGSYPAGEKITFRLSFSDKVLPASGATMSITFQGTAAGATDTTTITGTPYVTTAGVSDTILSIDWTVPSSPGLSMKNLKAQTITFPTGATTIKDDYSNPLISYTGSTETASARPIANTSSFQLLRPDLEIRSIRPRITAASPAMPTASGQDSNGGFRTENNKITLTFSAPVSAVSGKYITVRPYGNWALPPVLTVEEFDALYNYPFIQIDANGDPILDGNGNTQSVSAATRTTYQRRLTDVDGNGLPVSGSEPGNASARNSYVKNTHGVKAGSAGFVRPDTITKLVLDFDTDLYTGTKTTNLRDVFNAARWKQQRIHAASGSVVITGSVVEITMPQPLDKGRIWEVLIDDGAFQDNAGNTSAVINKDYDNYSLGKGYRFWTTGTETPVIRIDKISYDGNVTRQINADKGFITALNGTQRVPPIDTRVRIDCETPGAAIRYNLIRTRFQPAVGNAVFTDTTATNAGFFGAGINLNDEGGYGNRSIGSYNVADNLAADGSFNRLLVPTLVQTGTATLTNGTFAKTALDTWGNNLITGTNLAAAAGEIRAYSGQMFVGEALGEASLPTATATDVRLFNGRRDYINAAAQKSSVTTGDSAGPQLNVSSLGQEGVYKTTLLYRDPRKGGGGNNYNDPPTATTVRLARLLIQGFDVPVHPLVSGFPLRDADSNSSDNDSANNQFSKMAYRVGGTIPTTNVLAETNNNFIWVTWEIVTDWYQKGKGFEANGNGNYLHNHIQFGGTNANYNAVAATYGGVIYRYQNRFY